MVNFRPDDVVKGALSATPPHHGPANFDGRAGLMGSNPMRMTSMAALAAVSLLALSACKPTATSNSATADNGSMASENGSMAAASGSIDGTWKADVTTAKWEQKPDEYLLQNGTYTCKTCVPSYSIPADGAFHPVPGHTYVDQASVKVVNDKTVEMATKLKGRDTGHSTLTVSADGKTLGSDWTDTSIAGGKPGTGHFEETRVAAGPAGANAISGSWQPSKAANLNPESLTVTFKSDADMLHMSSPAGTSYDAKLDGTPTPIKGDPAGTTASVKKLADGSYQETDTSSAGKVLSVTTFSVGADGKLSGSSESKLDGSKFSWKADKA